MVSISASLRNRAKNARIAAWMSLVLILFTVFSLIYFFFLFTSGRSAGTPLEISSISEVPKVDERENPDIAKRRLEIELRKVELSLIEQKNAGITSIATSAIARIGAVLIGLYLVQILLGLTRYHFRLADHLLISAEALEACENDPDKLRVLMGVISTNYIDFGKVPSTPVEKVLDVVKECLARQKSG